MILQTSFFKTERDDIMDKKIDSSAWIAPSADVIGNVEIGADSSVWYHATIRSEDIPVVIGKGTNVQDNCVVHVDPGYPVTIGDYVTIGHGAIIHGCSIGDETLIGMGAIVLNGARIGRHCIVGAGALVTQNMEVPDGMMVLGTPAKIVRQLTEKERSRMKENALEYVSKIK